MAKISQHKLFKEKFTSEQTAKKRSWGFRVFLGALIGLFIVLSIVVKTTPILSLDLTVTKNIQQISFYKFEEVMQVLTSLGYPVQAIVVIGIFSSILFLFNRQLDSLILIFSSIGITFLSELIKLVVSRPRPDPALINQMGIFTRPDSFPSGHVLLYIGIYGYLLYLCHTRLKKGVIQTLLMVFLALILILIGVSRIYLGAHWFSDVLGSYLIGTIWIYIVILLESRLKSS